jgi:hypothetical protein
LISDDKSMMVSTNILSQGVLARKRSYEWNHASKSSLPKIKSEHGLETIAFYLDPVLTESSSVVASLSL